MYLTQLASIDIHKYKIYKHRYNNNTLMHEEIKIDNEGYRVYVFYFKWFVKKLMYLQSDSPNTLLRILTYMHIFKCQNSPIETHLPVCPPHLS